MSGYNADIAQPEEREPIIGQPIEEAPIQSGENVETMADKLLARTTFAPDELMNVVTTLKAQRDAIHLNRINDIQADDHRIQHIWEHAGEIADRRGYCDVFESIMIELGTGYTRTVEGYAQVEVTLKMTVSVPVEVSRADADDWTNIEVDDYSVNDAVGYATIDSDNIEDYKVVGFEPC